MIKRLLTLRHVCKKYNLKYKWTLFGEVGSVDIDDGILWVSLFQKHFYSVLFHEIGHVVTQNKLGFKDKYEQALKLKPRLTYGDCNHDVFLRLEDEAKASKFSLRVLKGKDCNFLKKCWHTYTGATAKHINSDELHKYVGTVAKFSNYFKEK